MRCVICEIGLLRPYHNHCISRGIEDIVVGYFNQVLSACWGINYTYNQIYTTKYIDTHFTISALIPAYSEKMKPVPCLLMPWFCLS